MTGRSAWKYGMLFPFLLVLFALNCNAGEKQGSLNKIHKTKKITVITRNNAHCYYTYRDEPMGFGIIWPKLSPTI